jgi:hypothetical protein
LGRLLPLEAVDLALLPIDLVLLSSRPLFTLLYLMTDEAARYETQAAADGSAASRVMLLMPDDGARPGTDRSASQRIRRRGAQAEGPFGSHRSNRNDRQRSGS